MPCSESIPQREGGVALRCVDVADLVGYHHGVIEGSVEVGHLATTTSAYGDGAQGFAPSITRLLVDGIEIEVGRYFTGQVGTGLVVALDGEGHLSHNGLLKGFVKEQDSLTVGSGIHLNKRL